MPHTPPPHPDTLHDHPLLRAVVEATAVAIFVKDREGRYTLVNRHTASLWGRDVSELVGKSDFELFPAAVAAELRSNDLRVLEEGETLERTEGGLGVGLTLARRLVDLHGGEVTAESAGHGEGTLVRVRLPRLPAAAGTTGDAAEPASTAVPPAGETATEAGTRGRRVLIVDDNRDSADSLGTLLELRGHRVEIVYDGESGLEAAQRFGREVVLLDIGLPHLDGYEVARRLRQDRDDLLIVAITGYGQESARERAAEAGFDHHMLKPVDLVALRDLLAGDATP